LIASAIERFFFSSMLVVVMPATNSTPRAAANYAASHQAVRNPDVWPAGRRTPGHQFISRTPANSWVSVCGQLGVQ
jgi:hypothetical protein